MKLNNAVRTVTKFCTKNQSTLHMVATLVGLGTTTYAAITGTTKAVKHIDEKKKELGKDKLTVKETAGAVWKDYIPTAVSLVATGANAVATKKDTDKALTAVATTLDLTTTAYNEYRKKVKEVIGEKEEAEIRKEVAKDRVKEVEAIDDLPLDLKHSTVGMIPCHDLVLGKWFWANSQMIEHAKLEMSKEVNAGTMWISVSDFYYYMGVSVEETGRAANTFGWNGYVPSITKHIEEFSDGSHYMIIDYDYELERDTHGDLRYR